jgi:hypothetical protein
METTTIADTSGKHAIISEETGTLFRDVTVDQELTVDARLTGSDISGMSGSTAFEPTHVAIILHKKDLEQLYGITHN